MMYHNKLAIAVKSNGKVLREFKDTAFIPFGSEYTLLIKNLNSVRVQVRVEIDGTDATEGTHLVIAPNSEMELKRFIKNGNFNEGNAFKFIERTGKIEKHKGIGIEDGLIRVEYQFERPAPVYVPPPVWRKHEYWTYDQWGGTYFDHSNTRLGSPLRSMAIGDVARGLSTGESYSAGKAESVSSYSLNSMVQQASATKGETLTSTNAANMLKDNDVGITVPGQVVAQKFTAVAGFPVETEKHVMVVKLLGETEQGQVVEKAVTVKHKPRCTSCGHQNKHNAKFCSECGTSLTLV